MAFNRSSALFATVTLDPRSSAPLYRQLFDALRDAILRGQLQPGLRLPSTRALADELDLSRNTVMLAYEQLLAEGYLEGRVGSGTFVSRTLPEEYFRISSPKQKATSQSGGHPVLSRRGETLVSGPEALAQPSRTVRPFDHALPAIQEFPFRIWSRLVARRWRARPAELLGYGDPAGYRSLREAIATYLGTTRGVQCNPEQVIVASGSLQPLDQVARLLLDPGDAVWIEDPCYQGFKRTLLGAGAHLVQVRVDEEGLDVATGISKSPKARMVHVTPSHQYPLGVTMSLSRRMALLEWASRVGAWVLEDDYGSEYRYRGRPLASLQGLDRAGRVIYPGSFTRSMFPALRLGYLVVPPELTKAFVAARAVIDGPPRSLDQSVLADFITEGHFVRHLRRMRTLYAQRQDVLLKALKRELDGLLEVHAADAGMFLVGWLPAGVDDRVASRLAAKHGVTAEPLSPLSSKSVRRGGLILGYPALEPKHIREGVRRLATALRMIRVNAKG